MLSEKGNFISCKNQDMNKKYDLLIWESFELDFLYHWFEYLTFEPTFGIYDAMWKYE